MAAKKRAPKKQSRPSRGPGKRAKNKEAVRGRILSVALDLFQMKGFDATTTKEIARKAKIAEGTVFNYFETKDDIALYFLELEVDHAIAAVRKNRALDKAPLEEKLFALIQAQIEFLEPHERFIGAAFVNALKPGSKIGFSVEAMALRDRYLAFVEELISTSYAPGTRPPLTWFAPQAFWIYYIGALLYWLHDQSPGKQSTLAFLDRSLRLGVGILQGGRLT
jgi:AcrR family transcriptional regulator